MKLSDLIPAGQILEQRGPGDPDIASVTYDSRKVTPGALFAALEGTRTHGMAYAREAAKRGAAAILYDGPPREIRPAFSGTVLRVRNARRVLAEAAHRFYDRPSHHLVLIGITGTNGKTTTCYLLESMLRHAGYRVGVIGTVNYRYGKRILPARTTTPESVDLQELLREMADAGTTHVIMEVSSHALRQERVGGCRFRRVLFTNLSRDHLDYHTDMEDYFHAKKRLFHLALDGTAPTEGILGLCNTDDPYGRRLLRVFGGEVLGYGMNSGASIRGEMLQADLSGIELLVAWESRRQRIRSPLIGEVNARNILAAAATALSLGVDPDAVKEGAARLSRVPGRMEAIRGAGGETVFVDYAHTPDALRKAVETLRALCDARLITVFGCGGDRDPGKRPLMGEAAGEGSDLVIVTSDNPRSEDPLRIIRQVEAGLRKTSLRKVEWGPHLLETKGVYLVEPDRATAIRKAVESAGPGDLVLIAGKGHETIQQTGTRALPFDDREHAREALRRKGTSP